MSAKNIQVRVHGKTYTLYEASQCFQIPWNTLRQRYYNYQLGDNLLRPVSHPRITIDGKAYSLKELSQRYGLNLATVHSRYYTGKRGKELILPPRGSMKPKTKQAISSHNTHQIYFHGRPRTLISISRECGIPYTTLRGRSNRGDRDDELVRPLGTKIRSSRRPLYINVHGIRSTFRQLSRDYNIPVDVLHDRYYQGKRGEKLLRPVQKKQRH